MASGSHKGGGGGRKGTSKAKSRRKSAKVPRDSKGNAMPYESPF